MTEPASHLTIILIRHAHSIWNLADELETQNHRQPLAQWSDGDFPLSLQGEAQCAHYRGILSGLQADSWLHSPLRRAALTARAICPDAPWSSDDGWRERSWGTLEASTSAERPHLSAEQRPDGGESLLDLKARVTHNLAKLSPGRHLIVSHGGIITMTAAVLDQVRTDSLSDYWQNPPHLRGNLQVLVWHNRQLHKTDLAALAHAFKR